MGIFLKSYITRDRIFPFIILTHGYNIHLKFEFFGEYYKSPHIQPKKYSCKFS